MRRSCAVSAGWDTRNRAAAVEMLPASATSTSTRRCLNSRSIYAQLPESDLGLRVPCLGDPESVGPQSASRPYVAKGSPQVILRGYCPESAGLNHEGGHSPTPCIADQICCKVSHVPASEDQIVIVSERVGPVTAAERAIETTGARVRGAPVWSLDDIRRHADDATVLLLGAVEPMGERELAAMPRCHSVVRRGVGYDNVDMEAASRLGVVVANIPDASVEEVSDHVLTLLLAVERRVSDFDQAVRMGGWERDPQVVESLRRGVRRFSELILGVVGLGRIGGALARKARGVCGRVLATDPVVTPAAAAAATRLVQGELPESVVNPAVLQSPQLRNPSLRRPAPGFEPSATLRRNSD
ncbi:MAG: hypothetical protein GEU93_16070 [Propionibacteriales bacterium]|nr:hypothetical protein [Propionibacteriales bacterium]